MHEAFRVLHLQLHEFIDGSAYNWVRPTIWSAMFSGRKTETTKAF
jgi:hypothetical protein